MAVSKFIQAVKDETRGRPRSTQWYRDKSKSLVSLALNNYFGMVKEIINLSMAN